MAEGTQQLAEEETSVARDYWDALTAFEAVRGRYGPRDDRLVVPLRKLMDARKAYAVAQVAEEFVGSGDPDADGERFAQEVLDVQDLLRIDEEAEHLLEDLDADGEAYDIVCAWTPRVEDSAAWTMNTLRAHAISARNDIQLCRANASFANDGAAPGAIDRWVSNFVRHELTDYEELLASLDGLFRSARVREEIDSRITCAVDAFIREVESRESSAAAAP